jgi:hypothetical protein
VFRAVVSTYDTIRAATCLTRKKEAKINNNENIHIRHIVPIPTYLLSSCAPTKGSHLSPLSLRDRAGSEIKFFEPFEERDG